MVDRIKRAVMLFVTALLLVTACKTPSRAAEVPAVIVNPSEQTHTELVRLIEAALGNRSVTLADDALTSSSLLTLERKPHRSLEGRPATGRMTESPERFRLVGSDAHCVLIHLGSGERMILEHARCVPEHTQLSPKK